MFSQTQDGSRIPLIWCLNLERRADRRFVLQQTLPVDLLQKVEFVKAVDGSELPSEIAKRHPIGQAGYAVRLSKRFALRRFWKIGAEALILLEDDVCVTDDFLIRVRWLMEKAPPDWEILFLGGQHVSPPTPTGIAGIERCSKTVDNHAWIIRRKAVPALRKILSPRGRSVNTHSDRDISVLVGKIPVYAPSKWIAHQRVGYSDNFSSMRHSFARSPHGAQMHPDEIAVVRAVLRRGWRVLEWGSGASTFMLADAVGKEGHVDSIEYERSKAASVARQCVGSWREAVVNVHLVPPSFSSDDPIWRARPKQFREYTEMGPRVAVGSHPFDACLIDGRARINCALAAAGALKPGGWLFFHDFADPSRIRYRQFLPDLLQHYELVVEVLHTPQTLSVFRLRRPCVSRG